MKHVIITDLLHKKMKHFAIEKGMKISEIANSGIVQFMEGGLSINEPIQKLIMKLAEKDGKDPSEFLNEFLLESIEQKFKS